MNLDGGTKTATGDTSILRFGGSVASDQCLPVGTENELMAVSIWLALFSLLHATFQALDSENHSLSSWKASYFQLVDHIHNQTETPCCNSTDRDPSRTRDILEHFLLGRECPRMPKRLPDQDGITRRLYLHRLRSSSCRLRHPNADLAMQALHLRSCRQTKPVTSRRYYMKRGLHI